MSKFENLGGLRLVNNFFVKFTAAIDGCYFPNQNKYDNDKMMKSHLLIEKFNNGCLTINKLVNGLVKLTNGKKETIETILEQYIAITYFPNGFINWHETHFHFVELCLREREWIETVSPELIDLGLVSLAKNLTDSFEEMHSNELWIEKDFHDTAKLFFEDYIKKFN